MYKLKIQGIDLPRLYVAESRQDAKLLRDNGAPYVVKPKGWDDERLLKAIFYRWLCRKFPGIDWRNVLGFNRAPNLVANIKIDSPDDVMRQGDGFATPDLDVTYNGEERESHANGYDNMMSEKELHEWKQDSLDHYLETATWDVDIEQLQALHLLPVFLSDIANAIKVNLMSIAWNDGWSKKLDAPLGHFQGGDQARNLMILDVSGSIPCGVSGTMVSLIDTLRTQADADLIITGSRSTLYKMEDELPSPRRLAYEIGGGNECYQFNDILRSHVLGKHWGNVIVFGDQDSPRQSRFKGVGNHIRPTDLQGTQVDNLMAFHTGYNKVPGYGLWVVDACPNVPITYNSKWVKDMKDMSYSDLYRMAEEM